MEKKINKEYKTLILFLVIIFLILGAMIFFLSRPLITGKTIVLATRPVDPFEPFRGQYILINYEISTIPKLKNVQTGDKIFIILEPDQDGIARYKGASFEKPKDGLFIKGIVRLVDNDLRLEYGIEQYFFERNAELPTNNITIEAKVDSSGQARIVNLLYMGKPVEIKYQKPSLTS